MVTASYADTSGQNHSFTNVTTGEVTENTSTQGQVTTQEVSTFHQLMELSGSTISPPTTADVNPTVEKTTKSYPKPSLQTTQMTPPNIQTTASPTSSILPQLNSSIESMKPTTEVQVKEGTPATTVVTSQTSNPVMTTRAHPVISSHTQSQDTGKTLTFQFTSDKTTHPATHPDESTRLISTTPTTTKPADSTSTSRTRQVTGGDATQFTSSYKTSAAMTTPPLTSINETKKTQAPPETNSNNETIHSKVVAGLIGGALVLMMVGFLIIFIKKRKIQKQQAATTEWAGPSPFLEDGADDRQAKLRSSNRISLSSFLPQRLSKRMSLLPEAGEELEDMTAGTFGDEQQRSTFGREVNGSDTQESNGAAVMVPESKSTGGINRQIKSHCFFHACIRMHVHESSCEACWCQHTRTHIILALACLISSRVGRLAAAFLSLPPPPPTLSWLSFS
uniref:Uncharacterized protein n=1 Tax=Monopterus albus TaxID=43700 RepID=A0A3Q3KHN3_MONAL